MEGSVQIDDVESNVIEDYDWPASESDEDTEDEDSNLPISDPSKKSKVCRRVARMTIYRQEKSHSKTCNMNSLLLEPKEGTKRKTFDVVLYGWLMPRAGDLTIRLNPSNGTSRYELDIF